MNKYADYLDELITKSNMTLTDISNKCADEGVKITVSYLSKLRNGKMRPPSFKISAVLAKVLRTTPEKLIALSKYVGNEYDEDELKEAIYTVYPDLDEMQVMEKTILVNQFWRDLSLKDLEIEKFTNDLNDENSFQSIITVPVLGNIAAGNPILASDHIEEWTDIPNMWNLDEDEIFVLKVKGDSMIGSRIHDGDKVIVKIQQEVESGEIAVVNVNGNDATLKRVRKINGQTFLYPDNPKYEPVIVDNENARIIGKVIQVMFEPGRR